LEDTLWAARRTYDAGIAMDFVKEGSVLRYFSMVTTLGAPRTVAAEELRLECMFPADDETEARHRELLAAHSKSRGTGG
jgi:hypothetical protein